MNFSTLLKHSRPRFWIYTLGPCLIAIAIYCAQTWLMMQWLQHSMELSYRISELFWRNVLWLLWRLFLFSFPVNLLIYGINDIADGDTDKYNPKKQWYEAQLGQKSYKQVLRTITGFLLWWLCIVYIILPWTNSFAGNIFQGLNNYAWYQWSWLVAWGLFVLWAIGYSVPPMRWKAKPFVDALSNVFYIIPGWITYYALGGTGRSWLVLLAGWMWTTPMHVFSAIPDIDADTQAWLATTATVLWAKYSLIYCMVWWLLSGIIAYTYLWRYAITGSIIYISMCLWARWSDSRRVYQRFPYVNTAFGFGLFWRIIFMI